MQVTSSKTDLRRYWHSSSFKMALLFTVLLGMCVGVLGYFSYYFNKDSFILATGKTIDTEIGYLSENNEQDLGTLIEKSANRTDRVYLLLNPGGMIAAGNMTKVPDNISVPKEGTVVFTNKSRTYAAKIHMFEDGHALMVGMDITDTISSYRIMQWLSFLSIFLMATVILTSFLISTFVVSRTNRIAMTAKKIMDTGDLSQRIVMDSRWDDLGNMAFVLNAFLERVERLMASVREVSDNVAHDLRTPLTRLHNDIERLKLHPALAHQDELASLCDEMTSETGRLLDTFNALLRIANIETGRQKQNFRTVDLRQILEDVQEFYEPLLQEKNIVLASAFHGDASCKGDPDLLFQAFANILDNAVKFTPPGGRISIMLKREDSEFLVTMQDSGPGISDIDKNKVFERFYRANASRTTEGNGLGLALVAAVVALHGASISLHDGNPGLKVQISFPALHFFN